MNISDRVKKGIINALFRKHKDSCEDAECAECNKFQELLNEIE